jgi:hypothetical protein
MRGWLIFPGVLAVGCATAAEDIDISVAPGRDVGTIIDTQTSSGDDTGTTSPTDTGTTTTTPTEDTATASDTTVVTMDSSVMDTGTAADTTVAVDTELPPDTTPPADTTPPTDTGTGPTTVTFPATTSTVGISPAGTLGAGGGGKYWKTLDFVTETFARSAPVTKLTVNFKMSDVTTDYCKPGTLSWKVMVNGTQVGTYSWAAGSVKFNPIFSVPGPDKTISQTYSFAAIAPTAGNVTLRIEATSTVCPGSGSWNWYPGGTATME